MMTAQYRPYRDEDTGDGADTELNGWPDTDHGHGSGHVQIYKNTTETIQTFTRRRPPLWMEVLGFAVLCCLFYLAGYLMSSHRAPCSAPPYLSLHDPNAYSSSSYSGEDGTIRERLKAELAKSAADFGRLVSEYSTEAHTAGSAADHRLAAKILHFFESHPAFERPTMKNYSVQLSLPDERRPNSVSLVDNSTGEVLFSSPHTDGYSLFSPAGNVTGQVLFINYGRSVDYMQLQMLFNATTNIFAGKILLAKQSEEHLSAAEQYKLASNARAAALLLYPDPQQFGGPKGAAAAAAVTRPYPDSRWLPADAVRSDSILWNGGGDPQTYGLPSNSHAFKDMLEFYQTVIPSQPISSQTAYHILRALDGLEAPADWQGGFNFTYKVGPGLKSADNKRLLQVRLSIGNQLANRTISNVLGAIRGRQEPDRWVIVGHKRDSHSPGALDSATGTATFLQLAAAFAQLVNKGSWRPRRSLLFASWGAEEFNLLGSTEWVEEMNKLLHSRAVAYVNINRPVTGRDTLNVIASPLLYHALFNATKEVALPAEETAQRAEGFSTVYDKWFSSQTVMRNRSSLVLYPGVEERLREVLGGEYPGEVGFTASPHHFRHEEAADAGDLLKSYSESAMQESRPRVRPLDMLGSYAPFLTMAGVPCVDIAWVEHAEEGAQRRSSMASSSTSSSSSSPHANSPADSAATAAAAAGEEESVAFEDLVYHSRPYPLLHTQYDQAAAVERFVDPHYRYHLLVEQVLAELVRSLSDSPFLPFNLLDYAQLLRDFALKSSQLTGNIMREYRANGDNTSLQLMSRLDLKSLEAAVNRFTNEAIRFHARQDHTDLKDPMAVRRINDQLQMVERQFLDHRGIPSNNMKRHLILSPADKLSSINGALETEGIFPALLDELDQIIDNSYIHVSVMRLEKHLPLLVNTIQSAADMLAESW